MPELSRRAGRVMPPRQVLLEGCRLLLREGTGIATYGRNLAAAVKHAGAAVDVLVGTDKRLGTGDPMSDPIGGKTRAEVVVVPSRRNAPPWRAAKAKALSFRAPVWEPSFAGVDQFLRTFR